MKRVSGAVLRWWARVNFWWWHEHQFQCTNKSSMHLGNEKHYWHKHDCIGCSASTDVLNADCERWVIVHG
jgi:hypothetical protein